MVSGRKLFGLHTVHFTDACEHIAYLVTIDGRKAPFATREIAERSRDFWRREGHVVADEIEEKHSSIRCGEVYY